MKKIIKKYLWVSYPLITIIFIITSIHKINVSREVFVEDFHSKLLAYQKIDKDEFISDETKEDQEQISNNNEVLEEQTMYQEVDMTNEKVYEKPISNSYTTRMTSFYANDGYGTGDCTGSGLCTWDFGINELGWYTYNDKLVIATATEYLLKYGFTLNEGVHTYKYYEEIVLTIDGIDYDAIVLDSCGNSMKTDRIDLFVSNSNSVKDTTIEVKRR